MSTNLLDSLFNSLPVSLPKILLLGDSLTQRSFDPTSGCWGAHLSNKFQRIADILPRGFSGYNTRWFLARLPAILSTVTAPEVACVLLWLGANDANEPTSVSGQHVPLGEYSTNLKQIIKGLEDKGIPRTRLLMATPPPYVHERFAATFELPAEVPSKSAELTAQYAHACREVAAETGVTLVDVHKALGDQPEVGSFLEDGLHFNRKGGDFVFRLLEPEVEKKFEQFSGEKWDPNHMWLPYWKDNICK